MAILCHKLSQRPPLSVYLKDEHNAKQFHNLTSHPVAVIHVMAYHFTHANLPSYIANHAIENPFELLYLQSSTY